MTLQNQIDILIDKLEKEENKNKELQCELITAKATIKHQEDLIQKMKLPQETIEHCFNTINAYLKQEIFLSKRTWQRRRTHTTRNATKF